MSGKNKGKEPMKEENIFGSGSDSEIEERIDDISEEEFNKRIDQFEADPWYHRTIVVHYEARTMGEAFLCPFPPCSLGNKLHWRSYVSIRQHAEGVATLSNYTLSQRVQHKRLANYLIKFWGSWEPTKKCKGRKEKKDYGGVKRCGVNDGGDAGGSSGNLVF